MNIFKIEVITQNSTKNGKFFYHQGELIIGEFKEIFDLALGSWDIVEYKLQWKEGLERLKEHDTSCLVTCVQDLRHIPIIERWKMYRKNETVYFQQQIIVPPMAPVIGFPFPLSEFNRTNCYERIKPRIVDENDEAVNEHGQLLIEWPVSYKAVEEFAKSFNS